MSEDRPKLTDPKEFAIIRGLYFDDNRPINEDLDPVEKLQRIEAKQRYKQNESR